MLTNPVAGSDGADTPPLLPPPHAASNRHAPVTVSGFEVVSHRDLILDFITEYKATPATYRAGVLNIRPGLFQEAMCENCDNQSLSMSRFLLPEAILCKESSARSS